MALSVVSVSKLCGWRSDVRWKQYRKGEGGIQFGNRFGS